MEGEIGRACSMHGKIRNAFKILIGKQEGKRSLWRHRCICRIILKWILKK